MIIITSWRSENIPSHLNNDLDEVLILSDHDHAEEIDTREVLIYVDDNDERDVKSEKKEDHDDENDFGKLEDDTGR